MLDLDQIRKLAAQNKWEEIDHQANIKMVSFAKNKVGRVGYVRMNIYYSTGTVSTAMSHPKKGATQMFKRDISITGLGVLFKNPRTHGQKVGSFGYRRREWMK